jgi:hypothetical protein
VVIDRLSINLNVSVDAFETISPENPSVCPCSKIGNLLFSLSPLDPFSHLIVNQSGSGSSVYHMTLITQALFSGWIENRFQTVREHFTYSLSIWLSKMLCVWITEESDVFCFLGLNLSLMRNHESCLAGKGDAIFIDDLVNIVLTHSPSLLFFFCCKRIEWSSDLGNLCNLFHIE